MRAALFFTVVVAIVSLLTNCTKEKPPVDPVVLDDRLTSNNQVGGIPYALHLSPSDKAALVAFLNTLTDTSMMAEEKFSDPFEE